MRTASQTRWTRAGTSLNLEVCDMQEDVRNDLKSQLALLIARGKTITAWASQNEVSLPTAYR